MGGANNGGSGDGAIWLRAVLAVPVITGTLTVDGGAGGPVLQAIAPTPGGAGAAGRTLIEQSAP